MDITVIVCTYNRCNELAQSLESVAESLLPPAVSWEVLVADNNSSDQTRKVVEELNHRYPGRFRYLFEPHPGKSYALNSAIKQANGEVLAFMDDDVTVEPTWLDNLTSVLSTGEWAGTGGRTLPAHPFSPPAWMVFGAPYYLGGILCATFDLGDEPRQLEVAPYGVNMAFRKAMFEKYGTFRTDLGPSPDRNIPRPNEDTEFGRRLMTAGERLRYEPSAVVHHPVPKDRVRKEYFLDWWFDYGRALVREWGRGPDVWGIPRPYLSLLKFGILGVAPRVMKWVTTVNQSERFGRKCRVWVAGGMIREFYWLARSGPKSHEGHEIPEMHKADVV